MGKLSSSKLINTAQAVLAVPGVSPDHFESARKRAWREVEALLQTARFWIAEGAATIVGALAFGGLGVLAAGVLFLLVLLALWVTAPLRQRNEARLELLALHNPEFPDINIRQNLWGIRNESVGQLLELYNLGITNRADRGVSLSIELVTEPQDTARFVSMRLPPLDPKTALAQSLGFGSAQLITNPINLEPHKSATNTTLSFFLPKDFPSFFMGERDLTTALKAKRLHLSITEHVSGTTKREAIYPAP